MQTQSSGRLDSKGTVFCESERNGPTTIACLLPVSIVTLHSVLCKCNLSGWSKLLDCTRAHMGGSSSTQVCTTPAIQTTRCRCCCLMHLHPQDITEVTMRLPFEQRCCFVNAEGGHRLIKANKPQKNLFRDCLLYSSLLDYVTSWMACVRVMTESKQDP